MSTNNKLMRIYLRDHLAGATAGAARARRLAAAEQHSSDAETLAAFARDLEEDRQSLISIMKQLDIAPNVLKNSVAAVAEKVGTLKANGRVVQRSPLTPVIELEAMQMGVRGKHSLWVSMQRATERAQLSGVDVDVLFQRAEQQLLLLAELHQRRAEETFGPSSH
jgi:hypothetical protein